MSEVDRVYYPSNLLTKSSTKTIKGEAYGWDTHILYLSPHKQNNRGKNLCPNATAGCSAACLYTAGRGRFSNVQKARLNKTELFLSQREWFLEKLYNELVNINTKDFYGKQIPTKVNHEKRQCVRLNGTSDIPWENIKYNGKNFFEHFPNLTFYDYSKTYKRLVNNKWKNYHLTFSRSEENHNDCLKLLDKGFNVAYVFSKDRYNDVITNGSYNSYPIQNGELSDLRFLDKAGSIVALKAKGDAIRENSGFVVR